MSTSTIKETAGNVDLTKLITCELYVGFFATATYPDGKPVAMVAHEHEYGIGVPRRPFFSKGVYSNEDKIIRLMKQDLAATNDTAHAFKMAGQLFQQAVQESITKLRTPPNSEATIEAKGSSNPLIDTGLMRRSVKWQIEEVN